MGWYATAQAVKHGKGPYGTVKESLAGESDPRRTLAVALMIIREQIQNGMWKPQGKSAKARLAYWERIL